MNGLNIEDNKSEECEEIDDSGVDNNLTSEINKIKSEDAKEKCDDFKYLLNGDVLIEEKINLRKNKQKKKQGFAICLIIWKIKFYIIKIKFQVI